MEYSSGNAATGDAGGKSAYNLLLLSNDFMQPVFWKVQRENREIELEWLDQQMN